MPGDAGKRSHEESTWVSQAYFLKTYTDIVDAMLIHSKRHMAQHAKPSHKEVCPLAQAVGWMCGFMSVTPAKCAEEHLQHTCLCCPGSSPQTTPCSTLCFHTENLLEKLQQALQNSFYCLDHLTVPQEIMFHHQT